MVKTGHGEHVFNDGRQQFLYLLKECASALTSAERASLFHYGFEKNLIVITRGLVSGFSYGKFRLLLREDGKNASQYVKLFKWEMKSKEEASIAAQLQVARALSPKEKEVKALGTIEAHHTITGAIFVSNFHVSIQGKGSNLNITQALVPSVPACDKRHHI